MSTPYAGADVFPSSILSPDDGDARTAAAQNIPDQGLADRTTWLAARRVEMQAFIGQVQALNFLASTTGVGTLRNAVYDKARRYWFLLGTAANIQLNNQAGQGSWSPAAPGGAGTEIYHNMAFDAAGNGVASGVNASGQPITNAFTASTNTWAGPNVLVASAVNTANGDETQITFDPVSGLYCALFRLFASPYTQVYTSPNRTTWTVRTPPANFGVSNSVNKMATNGLGRLVATANTAAGTIVVATSDDGGITWVARSNLTSVTTPSGAAPVWSASTSLWMLAVPNVTTHVGEVWTSTDGATWTKVATLAAAEVSGIAPVASLWVGLTSAGSQFHVVLSTDAGVSWKYTGRVLAGTALGVVAEPLGLALLTSTTFTPGIRAGMPATALT